MYVKYETRGVRMTDRRILLLDLKDDPELIERYRAWHRPGAVPPEVLASIRASGVVEMEIFQLGNRLVMLMTCDERFEPDAKSAADAADPAVQAWETLMLQFQKPLPFARPGEKWLEAAPIFRLTDH
jgi:L-rhamnose mutarotase